MVHKQTNKRTIKEGQHTLNHLDPTGKIKKKSHHNKKGGKGSGGYKKSKRRPVVTGSSFSRTGLSIALRVSLLVYQVYTMNLTRQLKSIQYCQFLIIFIDIYTLYKVGKKIHK